HERSPRIRAGPPPLIKIVGRSKVHSRFNLPISRRALVLAGASTALLTRLGVPGRSAPASQYRMVARPSNASLAGAQYPMTDVWAYDGKVPGPTLRLRQGEPVRIVVENQLDEETTVHWHGIRLPNAMDGVPGLTQRPIALGESFTYEFTPPDAGTFWYHPHADTLQQLRRGRAGSRIVGESGPIAVGRGVVWLI